MARVIYFDLEGPLSPQDNAFEVMGLIERGHEVFAILSRYDDLLALEGKENYEPGDTLKLIIPFLLLHNIKETGIKKVSERAKIVKGAKELIEHLQNEKWQVYIVSTSYEQHAFNIASQVNVKPENVSCTEFPLNQFARELKHKDLSKVEQVWNFLKGFCTQQSIEDIEKGKIWFDCSNPKITTLSDKLDNTNSAKKCMFF